MAKSKTPSVPQTKNGKRLGRPTEAERLAAGKAPAKDTKVAKAKVAKKVAKAVKPAKAVKAVKPAKAAKKAAK